MWATVQWYSSVKCKCNLQPPLHYNNYYHIAAAFATDISSHVLNQLTESTKICASQNTTNTL